MNEASTIIQGAAHEDANIIFGAVLDEAMGDEVKITVIATGFKEQEGGMESGARRERMLAEATLPTIVTGKYQGGYGVPIVPEVRVAGIHAEPLGAERIEVAPIEAARIAVAPIVPPVIVASGEPDWMAEQSEAVAETRELLPVPQSVFDDEFFRSPRRSVAEPEVAEAEVVDRRRPSARGFDSPDGERPMRVMYDEGGRAAEAQLPVTDAIVRVPVLSGAVAVEPAEADELDIPAFLRRGQ